MKRKWVSVELYGSDADNFRAILKLNKIDYCPSACGDRYTHFSIYASENEIEFLNVFLETL